MKIEVPQLGTLSWEDLWEKALAELPGLTQEWTNYNLADPGVVTLETLLLLLDLFYWQLDFFDEEEEAAYRRLLKFEKKAPLHRWWPEHQAAGAGVTAADLAECILRQGPFARVYVVPDHGERLIRAIVVPREEVSREDLETLKDQLEELRPVTMHLALFLPEESPFSLRVRLYPLPGYGREELREALTRALQSYLSPLKGLGGRGYPPGRPLFLSEIYACFEKVPGVDGIGEIRPEVLPPTQLAEARIVPAPGTFPALRSLEVTLHQREDNPCL